MTGAVILILGKYCSHYKQQRQSPLACARNDTKVLRQPSFVFEFELGPADLCGLALVPRKPTE